MATAGPNTCLALCGLNSFQKGLVVVQPSVPTLWETSQSTDHPPSLPSGLGLPPLAHPQTPFLPTHASQGARVRQPRFRSWRHPTWQLCDLGQLTQPLWASVVSVINGMTVADHLCAG